MAGLTSRSSGDLRRSRVKSLLKRMAGWILPYELFVHLDGWHKQRREKRWGWKTGNIRRLTAPNSSLKAIHRGQRCFILCNGPTVRRQNLLPLAGEIVISVSNGYHHPDFQKFKPRYHCVPQVTYGQLTEADVVRWFTEMHDNLGHAEIFLSTTEEPLVRRHGLFKGRKIHYIFLHGALEHRARNTVPDIAGPTPHVQSVAIMAIMCALYMGFEDIFLLGTEHDHFKTGTYRYFYEPTVLKGKDISTNPDGSVRQYNFDMFQELVRLWGQYRTLREIAAADGVRIWNATAGGELDEFPRVRLEDVVASPSLPPASAPSSPSVNNEYPLSGA